MLKQFLFALLVGSAVVSWGQEDTRARSEADYTLVKGGETTRFGRSQSDVTEYLNGKRLIPDESIGYRRAVFRLTIDSSGKVFGASRFYGSITPEIESSLIAAFMEMPLWKTSVREDQLSVVYIVVTVRKQEITTELY